MPRLSKTMAREPHSNSVHPLSRAAWRAWLEEHHDRAEGVWLVRYKTATGRPTLSTDDVVEEAIAVGWIDSVPKKLDAERSLLWVSPRRPGSNWSRLSKQRAARMETAGLMTPAGQAAIDRAKADGTWTALDDVEDLVVPDDLAAALAAYPPAQDEWDEFPPSTRRGILEWILTAKRPATRRKRIEETARLAEVGKRANQWPREG
ncbi:YdeI/OmpD-associated family protein [Rubrivirga sp.]|uniref:YdeI/OmpD-associated family protein n=1 Tax=Rubrivirga sp. TaxID=1885344 RepID=UPI003B51CEA0